MRNTSKALISTSDEKHLQFSFPDIGGFWNWIFPPC